MLNDLVYFGQTAEDRAVADETLGQGASASRNGIVKLTQATPEEVPAAVKSFDVGAYFKALRTNELGRSFLYSELVTSTQTILNDAGFRLPNGTVFTCFQQTQGRGRNENTWTSPAGCLMFTFKCQLERADLLTFVQYLVSLCMVQAVKAHCADVDIRIKWPNDLYIGAKNKIGGVLCQSTFSQSRFQLCVGLGLNVDNSEPTTCLNDHLPAGAPKFRREVLLAQFLNNFEAALPRFEKEGFAPFEEAYLASWLHSGQHVQVVQGGAGAASVTTVPAEIVGITASGYLRARALWKHAAASVEVTPQQILAAASLSAGAPSVSSVSAAFSEARSDEYELHPDGNSLDMMTGLVVHKKL